ncbi:MAG: glycosyltransferase family 9 protein [Candidatus Omnitrophica bacterium]|nr:glycosyltransferase family 9 protein [Candidatus Omnitrophota bacterium]
MKRLLIVRPDGIGDFIIFSAVLERYQKAFPDHQIDLLCDVSVKELVVAIPFIRKAFFINARKLKHPGNIPVLAVLLFCRYDVLVYPVYSRSLSGDLFSHFVRAKEKVVFDGDDANDPWGKRFGRNKYYTRVIAADKGQKRELDRNVEFIAKLSGQTSAGEVVTRMWFLAEDQICFDQIKKEYLLGDGQYVILSPGAGVPIRWWPAEKWVALAQMFLSQDHACRIVVIGAGADKEIVDAVVAGLEQHKSRTVNLYGKISLRIMAKLIAGAKLLVGTESAAVHMAAAVNTPNVCIMGGGHFGRFYPYGDLSENRIVSHKMDCFGCNWQCKFPESHCITMIEPGDVLREVGSI